MAPIDFSDFLASEEARRETWRRRFETGGHCRAAQAQPRPPGRRRARPARHGQRRHHPEHRRPAPGLRRSRRAGHRTARQLDLCALSRLRRRYEIADLRISFERDRNGACLRRVRRLRQDGHDLFRSGDAGGRDAPRRDRDARRRSLHRCSARRSSSIRRPDFRNWPSATAPTWSSSTASRPASTRSPTSCSTGRSAKPWGRGRRRLASRLPKDPCSGVVQRRVIEQSADATDGFG